MVRQVDIMEIISLSVLTGIKELFTPDDYDQNERTN
jgi:hypothetical protein